MTGLTNEEVQERIAQGQVNNNENPNTRTYKQIILENTLTFFNFLNLVLLVLVLLVGSYKNSMFVGIIFINTVIGIIQEVRAKKTIDKLAILTESKTVVLREGKKWKISTEKLVVDDLIFLKAGEQVPADAKILEGSLEVNESLLTGEADNLPKNPGDELFSGSFVTYGRGRAVVTNVGMQTEVGKIAGLLKSTSEKQTPLQANLDDFGKKLSILILIFCGILFAISVFRGEKISSAFMFAVALAVAAIPEALSSIVTIVLSFGTQKMAKEHAIIRKLQAVEGLGSVSVICSDKTGTLTQNKMTVEDYYIDGKRITADAIDVADPAQRCLLDYSILCNDSTNENGVEIGDPTETALINLGSRYGIEAAGVRKLYPREGELPFDSDRKMMSTLHRIDDENRMIVKGAVDRLLELTDRIWTKDGVREITEADKEKIRRQNQEFSMEGLRVLAFTYREIPENHVLTTEDENHLVFLGLIAMMDPPREESKAAVAECIKAGIRPVMITGDHKITAAAWKVSAN